MKINWDKRLYPRYIYKQLSTNKKNILPMTIKQRKPLDIAPRLNFHHPLKGYIGQDASSRVPLVNCCST